jgi:hypothetical protein
MLENLNSGSQAISTLNFERLLDRKGLMGWVCLSVTPLLQHLENHMSKEYKGDRPERQLAALAKQALLGHQLIYRVP